MLLLLCRYTTLEEQLCAQQTANDQLQLELQARPTAAQLQELQQQVQVLPAVGYGSVEDIISTTAADAGWSQHSLGSQGSEGMSAVGYYS